MCVYFIPYSDGDSVSYRWKNRVFTRTRRRTTRAAEEITFGRLSRSDCIRNKKFTAREPTRNRYGERVRLITRGLCRGTVKEKQRFEIIFVIFIFENGKMKKKTREKELYRGGPYAGPPPPRRGASVSAERTWPTYYRCASQWRSLLR